MTAPADRARPVRHPRLGAARLAGVLYLLTFVTSVPTLSLYAPLHARGFVTGAGSPDGPVAGALLEVGLAVTCAGTAVVLVPLLRRHGETLMLGYLAARLVEAALVLVGVGSVLAVVALRTDAVAGAEPVAEALLSVYDATFLLGQSVMPAVCALTLGTVLYRSALVPRIIPAIGLAGAPLLLLSDVAQLVGLVEQRSAVAGLGALPIAAWELALGVYLVRHGLRSTSTGR